MSDYEAGLPLGKRLHPDNHGINVFMGRNKTPNWKIYLELFIWAC